MREKLLKRLFPYIIIAVVASLVFANTLSFPVMDSWDDDVFVRDIAEYLNFRPANVIHLMTVSSFGNYVPLVNLSYAVDHSICGLDGFMYHFQNILWHIAACVGLFGCIRLLGVSDTFALLVTLLYAVHPQRAESVAWVAERRDVMCGAFYFWSFFCYMRFRERGFFSLGAFVLFICACLSKPAAVTMPVVFAMYEIWKSRSFLPLSKYRWIIPYVVVSAIVAVGTSVLQLNPQQSGTVFEKILRVFHNYAWYFVKNLYPGEMAPIYPNLVFDNWLLMKVSLFYIALSSVVFYLAFRARNFLLYSLVPFAVAYAVTLFPTIGFVPIGTGEWDYADRYSYIPSAILAATGGMLLYSAAGKFSNWRKFRQMEIVALLIMILFCAWITFFYNYTWKSYLDIISITVAHDPPNRAFLCRYAVTEFAARRNDEAEKAADYLLSVEKKDHFDHNGKSIYYTAMAIKAAALDRRGDINNSRALFDESLAYITHFIFQNPTILETAAHCYLKTGNKKKAIRCYDLLIVNFDSKKSNLGLFHFYKGISFYIRGNLKMAEVEFSQALRLIPEDDYIKVNLDEVRNKLKKNKQ